MAQSDGDKQFSEQLEPLMNQLREMLEAGIGNLFPGCVIGCANKTESFIAAAGTMDGKIPMQTGAKFDIASVTKVFLNTLALRLLPGSLLHAKVSDHVPMNGKFRDLITPHHLLTFGVEYGDVGKLSELKTKDEIIERVLNSNLLHEPGKTYRYTNISSIILGFYMEAVFGRTLNELLTEQVFNVCDLKNTTFTPTITDLVVPSEFGIKGTVQDESSRMLGPNGSAGLFSTVGDLLLFGQSFLKKEILPEDIVEQIPHSQFGNTVALGYGKGWGLFHQNECDLTDGNGPLVLFKKNGFSGAHIVVFPENDFVFVCLANICYPNRPSQEGRDKFTNFHKKTLRFLYENRDVFLADYNQSKKVNFIH